MGSQHFQAYVQRMSKINYVELLRRIQAENSYAELVRVLDARRRHRMEAQARQAAA